MPTAPRPKGKGKKIAYKILGVPANMQKNNEAVPAHVNKRLIFEETQRVR
jgi:hypothetical protein